MDIEFIRELIGLLSPAGEAVREVIWGVIAVKIFNNILFTGLVVFICKLVFQALSGDLRKEISEECNDKLEKLIRDINYDRKTVLSTYPGLVPKELVLQIELLLSKGATIKKHYNSFNNSWFETIEVPKKFSDEVIEHLSKFEDEDNGKH